VPPSVNAGSGRPAGGRIVHVPGHPEILKFIVSGPGLLFAAQIASRKLVTPSGPGRSAILIAPHAGDTSSGTEVVVTVIVSACAGCAVVSSRSIPKQNTINPFLMIILPRYPFDIVVCSAFPILIVCSIYILQDFEFDCNIL
jgi:hypothetical protein